MNVYIGGAKDYSAMRGPAPEGFHVPLTTEWQGLKTIMDGLGLTSGNNWKINLHMPFAGNRHFADADLKNQGSYGRYWLSSPYGSGNPVLARCLYLSSSDVYANYYGDRAYGFSVRCFKDTFELPTSTWTVINGTLGSAGIFRDTINGLISITGDGSTGYTIADKNLGATTVYSDGDTLAQANMGNMFQWGNNYGFPSTGSVTTSSTQVNASAYGPGNYYSSSTFITGSQDWSSVHNDNLRGGETGIVMVPAPLKNDYIGENPFKLQKIFDFTTQDLHGFTYRTTAQSGLYIDTTNHYATNYVSGSSYGNYGCYYKQVNYKKCRQRIKGHLTGAGGLICGVGNNYAPSSGYSASLGDNFSRFFVGIKGQSSYKNYDYPTGYVKTDDHYFDIIFDNGTITTRVLDLNENVLWEATNTSSETTQKYIGFCGGADYNVQIYIKEYWLAYEE